MKVVILEPNPDLSTNPTLINLISRLSDDGISVDIHQPSSGLYLELENNDKNVKSYFYNYGQINIYKPSRFIQSFNKIILFMRLFLEKKIVIIAIDPRGIIEAYKYYNWLKIPFIYFSFEIFFMDEFNSNDFKKMKKKEIEASQKSNLIIIQDQNRGKLLENENGLSCHQFFYLPVAPSALHVVEKTDFLREKYNITKEKMIVIHAGSFSDWTYAKELIKSTANWPENFILLIHTRSIPNEKMKQLMSKRESSNIIFSNKPCNDSIFQKMLASADIGLALYNPLYSSPYIGKNLETIGLSSGKFSYYMKCGLPTISIKQRCYEDLLDEYKFGINIEDFHQMPAALLDIKHDYSTFSTEAKRLFKEKLDFNNYYPDLKERIIQLVK